MAFVPFPLNSAGVPPAPSPGRAVGAGRPQPAGVPNVSRAPQRAAADTRPVGASAAKGTPAFAQVLAAARGDGESGGPDETSSVGSGTGLRDSEREFDAAKPDDREEEPVAVVAPVQDETRAVPVSSWLLLALAQRPLTAPDHDTAAASPDADGLVDATGASVLPFGNAASITGMAGDLLASVTGDDESPAGESPFAALGVTDTLPEPALETTLATQVTSTGADPSTLLPYSSDPLPEAGTEALASASTLQPAPDVVARWRAAARALAATGGARMTSTDAAPGVASDTSAAADLALAPTRVNEPTTTAPGVLAAQELAKLVGTATGPASAGAERLQQVAQVTAAEGAVAEATSGSGTRAAEILMRLARAGADVSTPAGGRGDDVAGTVVAQIMASVPVGASATPVAPSAPAAPVLPPAVGEQVNTHIVSSLKMQWKDGIGEAKLHLRPDAYGAVTVALKVEQGAVTAVVRSDNPQVQEWVLQHQQSLRQQMEAAGLHLEELTVTPDDRGQPQQEQDAEPQSQSRRRARRAGTSDEFDAPVFELLA